MPCFPILLMFAASALPVRKEEKRARSDDGNRNDVPRSEGQDEDHEEVDLVIRIAGMAASPGGRNLITPIRPLERGRGLDLYTGELAGVSVLVAFPGLDDEVVGRRLSVRFGNDEAAPAGFPDEGTLPLLASDLGET